MATQSINYDINVNTGQAVNSIGNLETELAELKNQLASKEIGGADFQKLTTEIQKTERALGDAQQTVEGFTLEKKLDVADGAIKVVAGSVAALTGGLGLLGIENENFEKLTAQATNAIAFGMGIKDLSEGIGKFAKNLKLTTVAQKAYNVVQRAFNAIMSANPVAIVILSITTLIGLVVALKDKFEVLNNIFEYFKGLVNAVGEALGLTATAEEKAAAAAKAASEQRIKDIDNELKVRKAAGEETVALEREKQQELINITEEGTQERKDAEADLAAFEAGLIKEKADAEAQAAADAKKRRDDAKKEADAQKAIDDQKDLDDAKAKADALAQFRADLKKQKEDEAVDNEVERLELEFARRERELEELNAEESDRAALKLFYANKIAEAQRDLDIQAGKDAEALSKKEDAIDKKKLADKEAIEKAKVAVVGDTFGAIANILGEASAAGKAFATGQALINTYQGVTEVLASKSILPEPFATIARIANIATVLATGFKTIKQINSVQPMQAGGGAPSLAAAAPPTRTSPSLPNTNIDLGTAPEANVDNSTVRAYVVSGDITSTQEADAKLSTRRAISG